ncbi:MAG TPA: hypothetical protein VL251_09295 [Thermomonas sp.]|jgi:hypothetical protein|nr:hypothetical protein [Thermomonas sp.]
MTKTLHVSLDTSVSPPALRIEQHGLVHVDKEHASQAIAWQLTGALAEGRFASPGFRWRVAPPAGIFGAPTPAGNGKSLSIDDDHPDAASDGEWPYELRVDYQGVTYTCPSDGSAPDAGARVQAAATLVRDPIIINH